MSTEYIYAAKLNKLQSQISHLCPDEYSFLRMSISIAAKRQSNYEIKWFFFAIKQDPLQAQPLSKK